MIVKNESIVIQRCLDSVRGLIDHIVITDTGSTDGTPGLSERYLADYNLPGKVCLDTWLNFGYNRTRSVANAIEWLTANSIPLSTNYILTIDADMVGRFDRDAVRDALVNADVWMAQQRNALMQYENVRFFRSDRGCRSLGVTHEYWDCPSPYKEGRMPISHFSIDDRGDGGSKADKFERDIRLLHAGLVDEPQNVRYLFYLAQSYSDSGKTEEALTWYQRRVEAGGWQEERFIAHKRMGELYRARRPEKAVEEWLKAWEVMPSRAESLYELVRFYRINGQNQLAFLFLEKALSIPFPTEAILFVEHPVYRYRLMEELSILGYYIGRKQEGLSASQFVLMSQEAPADVRELAHRNSFHYLEKIPSIATGTLSWTMPDGYQHGSACFINRTPVGVLRSDNYRITDQVEYKLSDEKIVRTTNYWVEGDRISPLQNNHPPLREAFVRGIEDIRWVERAGERYGLGTSFEYGPHHHPSIVLFSIKEGQIDQLSPITYRNEECQKNWTLYVEDERLYAVYSHSPLTILELSTEKATFGDHRVVRTMESGYDLSTVRGSANMVWVGSDRIFLVHGVVFCPARRYYHRFVRYDREWKLTGVSDPFYFRTLFVEFALSCVYDEAKETMTTFFSTRDVTTEWVETKWSDVKWIPFIG